MRRRFVVLTLLGALAFAPAAHAEDFALQHQTAGATDARAEGNVTFPDAGGAVINLTLTDAAQDGWCAYALVRSNLPPSTQVKEQVCNVGAQKTFSIPLPAVSRCDVTFVDVQVGRIDPSNGNKTELGDYRRITNPCPPLPQPTPAPTPAPPPPPSFVDARIKYEWHYYPRWTRNDSLQISRVPAGAAVELRCRGKGCPSKRRTVPVHNGSADAHRLLRGHHLRVGAVLELRVTRADMIGQVTRFTIRRNRKPSVQDRCLPIGATSPRKC
jgi:hypothetical protein